MAALAIMAIMAIPASARAAPPTEIEEPEICEGPTLEDARLITGRDLYARANERFEQNDYLGAIEAWEQVLLLMPDKVAALRVQLAHAHRGAYGSDDDPEHLRSAHALFSAQLISLEPDDVARADLEGEISTIEAELEVLAEAEVKAKAEAEDEIRQEQIRLNDQVLAAAEAKHQRGIQKIYLGAGGSMAGLGVGSLAAMTAFLVNGARLDREGQAAAVSTPVRDGYYLDVLTAGAAQNRAALTTGIVGGVLLAAGGSLLVVAAIRHKRGIGRAEEKVRGRRVAITPTLGGLQLRF